MGAKLFGKLAPPLEGATGYLQDNLKIIMKIWLTADSHFNHTPQMVEYCGRPDDYEKRLVKGLKNIPAGDVLVHLGDVCIGNDIGVHKEIIEPLRCKKWLLRGNHDKKSIGWYLGHGWDAVMDTMLVGMGGKRILLSHEPQKPSDNFDVNIHGHFHNIDFRKNEVVEREFYDEKIHVLLAVEYTHYLPVTLANMVQKFKH